MPAGERDGGDPEPDRSSGRTVLGRRPTRRRVLRTLLLLALAVGLTLAPYALVSAASLPGSSAGPDRIAEPACTNPTAATADGPVLNATVERVAGTQRVRVTYDAGALAAAGETFSVSTAGARTTVLDATGFRADGHTYTWTGDPAPSITYRYAVTNGSGGVLDASAQFAAGEDWALAPIPAVSHAPVEYSVRPDGLVPRDEFRGGIAYVGSLSAVERAVGCQEVTIHYPGDVQRGTATAIGEAIAVTSEAYPLGHRSEAVTVLVTPLHTGVGGYTVGDFMTVNPSGTASPATIATHEYVHTRQRNSYAPRLRWLTEAVPSYYMYRLQAETGRISTAEYVVQLYAFDDRAEWNRQFSATTTPNHYYRGAVTLAALDQRIREATGGERTLLDVIRRLNAIDGTVTLPAFEETVSAVAGESLSGWVDRHVVAGEPVTLTAPAADFLPAQGWVVLGTYDLLLSTFPPVALVFVLMWYTVLGAVTAVIGRLRR
ncbi:MULTISPECIES: hypothetical protein [Salinibaculum]|uniref:hypothetical protein n=1 Tax=Salinibaculum TaxID=2732368 RepID=UPI0030D531BF